MAIIEVVAGVLVALVELGKMVSSSNGGGLVLGMAGSVTSSLVVASVVLVVLVVAVADNRGLRAVVVLTLLGWATLSTAVHRLPLVVVKMNDLAPEERLRDDMLKLDLRVSLFDVSSRRRYKDINIDTMNKITLLVNE